MEALGSGTGPVYVSLTVEYKTTAGNIYNTGAVTRNGRDSISVTAAPPSGGTYISAVSYHGIAGKEFMIGIGD